MLTRELHYDLPSDLLATHPAEPRDSARLMVIHRDTGVIEQRAVRDLPTLGILRPGDVMVFNQSKVIPAFLHGTRTATGGRVTGLYLGSPDPADPSKWHIMLESRGLLTVGETITFEDGATLTLLERLDRGEWMVRFCGNTTTLDWLTAHGSTPLPPYIRKARKAHREPPINPGDAQRYNTVYASDPGSVAAPTAGLHFTPELLAAVDARGVTRVNVTLHIGAGTFAPMRTERIEDHPIHSEWVDVPGGTIRAMRQARRLGGRILVVGTTSVRALESLPAEWETLDDGFRGWTKLFIHPSELAFEFRFTDRLMTNFHLPESTLLAMVAALPDVGLGRLKNWYSTAIKDRYHFYSYGDAMLIV